MTTNNYGCTIGMLASVPGHKRRLLVRFEYELMGEGFYRVNLVHGTRLAPLGMQRTVSPETMDTLLTHNDVMTFRNFAALFDVNQ